MPISTSARRVPVAMPYDKIRSRHHESWWQRFWEGLRHYRRDLLRSLVFHVGLFIILSSFIVLGPAPQDFIGPLEFSMTDAPSQNDVEAMVLVQEPPKHEEVKQPPQEPDAPVPAANPENPVVDPDRADGDGQADGMPDEFSQRRRKAGGKAGDVTITLIFDDISDLDLHVYDPAGEHVYYSHPRSATGARLDVDRNARPPLTDQAVENVFWGKDKAPTGHFRIGVKLFRRRTDGEIPYRIQVQVLKETRIYEGRFPAANRGGRFSSIAPICAVELRPDRGVVWQTPEEFLKQASKLAVEQQQRERDAAKQWRRADGQFRRGLTSAAKRTLERLVARWPNTRAGRQAKQSLDHWEQLLADRRRRRQ